MDPIQKPDPFEPHSRTEGAGVARFWPDLFIAELTLPDLIPSTPDAMLAEMSAQELAQAAASLHEQVHWLQTTGTTFGRLMTMIRLAAGGLAEAILATATDEERSALDRARRAGVAPAARDARGRLLHSHHYSHTLQSLLDHWWACTALDPLLIDARQDLLDPVTLRLLVGLGLRYARCDGDLRLVFNAPDADFQGLTEALAPADASIPEGVTVREIEEGAAMVAQHLYLEATRQRIAGERLEAFTDLSEAWLVLRRTDPSHRMYWTGWETYAGDDPDRMDRARLDDFLLVCDLALCPDIPANPKLPLGPWSDFHPTLRFKALVKAAKAHPPRGQADGPNWWRRRRRELVRLARLSDGGGSRIFTSTHRVVDDEIDPTSRMRQFATQASHNVRRLRLAAPASLISPFGADDHSTLKLERALRGLRGPSWSPPIVVIRDVVVSTIPDLDLSLILRAAAARRAVQSWLTHCGPLNFAGLSKDAEGRDAVAFARRRLQSLFGLEVPSGDQAIATKVRPGV